MSLCWSARTIKNKSSSGAKRRRLVAGALILAAFLMARPASAERKVSVFVSVLPQVYFVERIGGGRVDVRALVGPGASPHHFEPTPKQVAELSRSKIFFRVGVPFENTLVGKITGAFRDVRIVDTRKNIPLMRSEDEHEGEGGPDPHIWLDPKLAKIMVRNICDALKEVEPAHAEEFEGNVKALLADLDRVDAQIAEVLKPFRGREFLVYHPAFGYFGRSYGLRQVSIEDQGKEPGARRIASIIELARKRNIRIVFVQPQFSRKSAEAVAREIGGAVVAMDALAVDYLLNLERMAAQLKEGLKDSGMKGTIPR